jgi:hypothetical protein
LEHLRSEAIVPAEGDVMSKIKYLQEQAARAERLAKTVMDALTVQRLQSFAADCRQEIKTHAENERPMETANHSLSENAEVATAVRTRNFQLRTRKPRSRSN